MDDDKITAVTTVGFLAAMIGYLISAIAVSIEAATSISMARSRSRCTCRPPRIPARQPWLAAAQYPGDLRRHRTPDRRHRSRDDAGAHGRDPPLSRVRPALLDLGDFYVSMKGLIIGRPKK